MYCNPKKSKCSGYFINVEMGIVKAVSKGKKRLTIPSKKLDNGDIKLSKGVYSGVVIKSEGDSVIGLYKNDQRKVKLEFRE